MAKEQVIHGRGNQEEKSLYVLVMAFWWYIADHLPELALVTFKVFQIESAGACLGFILALLWYEATPQKLQCRALSKWSLLPSSLTDDLF